jgi:Cullin binding
LIFSSLSLSHNTHRILQCHTHPHFTPNKKIEIATLGEKLGMADVTEDVRILVLLWKFKCKKPGCIGKDEWLDGCDHLQVDSWDSLQKLLPSLDPGFLELADYKSFHKFCFQFNRQGTHKSLDKDVVISLLQIVLKDSQVVPTDRLTSFVDFLGQHHELDKITSDQWVSFLDFCVEVKDLAEYEDSTSAWPVLLDEYVEFLEKLLSK